MNKAGKFIAMLIRRWGSKTPKRAKIISIIIGTLGTSAVIVLSIPSLGLPLWLSIGVGLVAATSLAYEQAKDESPETIIKETRGIFKK